MTKIKRVNIRKWWKYNYEINTNVWQEAFVVIVLRPIYVMKAFYLLLNKEIIRDSNQTSCGNNERSVSALL